MFKESMFPVGGCWFDEHIECKRASAERAAHLRDSIGLCSAVEVDRRSGGDTRGVRHTFDLEVIVGIKVVAGNWFVEA